MKWLLVGATQTRGAGVLDRYHNPLYTAGVVAELDTETGTLEVRFRHSALLKGASWDGPLLLLNTDRDLLWLDPETWTVRRHWTHPWLNDVHHALRHDGRVWIANTGLDAVVQVDGDRVDLHGLDGPATPPRVDQRALRLTHRVHPNHLFVHDGRLWVTRFHQRDAVTLCGAKMAVDIERPHDGVVHEGAVWFTTVDGHLVRIHDGERRVVRVEGRERGPLGWCRSLALLGDEAWVGFSRLRATRIREHLAWARGSIRGQQIATDLPTRICRVSTGSGEVLDEFVIETVSIDAVFAIVPAVSVGVD